MSNVVCQNLSETTIKLNHHNQEFRNRSFDLLQTPKESSFSSLCTENLGSETGSDDDAIFSTPPPSLPIIRGLIGHITRFLKYPDHKFPPPLTSSLQVRRRSEGGRLIIEAVEAKFNMQAARTDGRLRICFLMPTGEEEEEEEEEEVGFEVEMESEKYKWVTHCKEEGGDRNQWKPAVGVAIS